MFRIYLPQSYYPGLLACLSVQCLLCLWLDSQPTGYAVQCLINDFMNEGTLQKTNLIHLTRAELEQFVLELNEPAFRGRQLYQWIFGKGARSFEAMTDLPSRFRSQLQEQAEIKGLEFAHVQFSKDRTIKYLFELASGRKVESVLIPDFDETGTVKRLTVCVSSQVGCAMGCSFCATGLMGFKQNLTAGEIYDQVWQVNDQAHQHFGRGITNIVYMGMGEPLQNYTNVMNSILLLTDEKNLGLSAKRITVSTVGLSRRIRQLADERHAFNLAVSLHAPTDEKRSSIMPVNRNERTDLKALTDALKYYTQKTNRKVTLEYCMFAEYNDTREDATYLAGIANQIASKVNLIMYNPVPELPFKKTSETRLNRFIQVLTSKKVRVTVRRSRGDDIAAACGQLLVEQA